MGTEWKFIPEIAPWYGEFDWTYEDYIDETLWALIRYLGNGYATCTDGCLGD
jgi:hypothetical protein